MLPNIPQSPFGRRRFLQNAALFSTGLITSSLIRPLPGQAADEPVDAIVIGSGFGGAIAAHQLAKRKIKTLVLERGRRWDIVDPTTNSTFATFRNPDGRAAWLSPFTFNGVPVNRYTGVLESRFENGLPVLAGAGVGGGSLVYNAVLYQPTRDNFRQVFSTVLGSSAADRLYDDLDRIYYPRVRAMLKPKRLPQDLLDTDYYLSTRMFLEQARAAGIPTRLLLEIAVDWNIVRDEIRGKRVPATILGEHWFGINSGAKNSLDRNYLAQAEKTGYAEIVPLHIATAIAEVPGGYRVTVNQINETGEVLATKDLTCRYLFLAAGSMGTSGLLVKARETGSLSRLNSLVGTGWGTNGMAAVTRRNVAPRTNPTQGGPATAVVEFFSGGNPLTLTLAPSSAAPEGSLPALGIGIPNVQGHFVYDAATDRSRLVWPTNNPIIPGQNPLDKDPTLRYALQTACNTLFGIDDASLTFLGATAHPLGGAVMGQACDEFGRVKGYSGLYVVDGALIPGSTACTNPAFTIAAIAERNMEQIMKEDLR